MYRTIIFDIGNVLMTFDYRPYLTRLLGESAAEQVDRAVWGTGLWAELDRGGDPDTLFQRMEQAGPQCRREIRLAMARIRECMSPRDYAEGWIRSLKERGYQVLYLSNYSHYVMDAMPEALSFLPLMDGGIFSCDVHYNKPEPEIYRLLLERYGLDPAACIFLDDTAENLTAAAALGIHTLRFTTPAETMARLDEALEAGR